MMQLSRHIARTSITGVGALALLGALGAATMTAPPASAAPDCSTGAVNSTVSSVTGSARQYLAVHQGANEVITAATGQPRPEAAANIRDYFTANPQEYYELRGILSPIGDLQQQCNISVLSPDLASAYAEFMSG